MNRRQAIQAATATIVAANLPAIAVALPDGRYCVEVDFGRPRVTIFNSGTVPAWYSPAGIVFWLQPGESREIGHALPADLFRIVSR